MSERLAGTWSLLSCTVEGADGTVSHPLGAHPSGLLTYADTGHMMVAIQAGDRERFESDDILRGSESEQARAAGSYLSYAGTWALRDDTVTHDVEVSLFPNWVGTRQERHVDLRGDRLMLTAVTARDRDEAPTARMTWQRVSSLR